MARIRSIHPGIFTDEQWASVSVTARWLAVGLMTEADDNGVFEWKPLQFKMRIFPADSVDIPALLSELQAAEIVQKFCVEGKEYGAIRNFCRYQRPRKPKSIYPTPSELHTFIALSSRSSDQDGSYDDEVPQKSEPPPAQPPPVPQKSEKSPQMEDGGGNRKGKDNPLAAQPYDPRESDAGLRLQALEIRLKDAAGWQNEPAPGLCVTGPIDELIRSGADLEIDVLPVIRAKAGQVRSRKSWAFFIEPIKEAMAQRVTARAAPGTVAAIEDRKARARREIEEHEAKFRAEQANGNLGSY